MEGYIGDQKVLTQCSLLRFDPGSEVWKPNTLPLRNRIPLSTLELGAIYLATNTVPLVLWSYCSLLKSERVTSPT